MLSILMLGNPLEIHQSQIYRTDVALSIARPAADNKLVKSISASGQFSLGTEFARTPRSQAQCRLPALVTVPLALGVGVDRISSSL